MPSVGRNDPCPCGSGKKYKRCHFLAPPPAPARAAATHPLDQRLVQAMMRYADRRFRDTWDPFDLFGPEFATDPSVIQIGAPWSVYEARVDGKRIVAWYLEEHGASLTSGERAWLESQQRAWPSYWQVVGIDAGVGLRMRDLLTGEERFVYEVRASRAVSMNAVVLARVVDHDGFSVVCGMHGQTLPPELGEEVADDAKKQLRAKTKGRVPVARLGREDAAEWVLDLWLDAVDELNERYSRPPKLHNTDGDELLFTVDHYTLDPAARLDVRARLVGLEGSDEAEPEGDRIRISFSRPGNPMHKNWDNTIVGSAELELSQNRLKLETNSISRADALRAKVEAACGNLIAHTLRDHTDPEPMLEKARSRPPSPAPERSEEERALLLDFKARHYAGWVDEPVPALNGKTPRQAAKRAGSRAGLERLLRGMEHSESRLPRGEQYDFDVLRRALGLSASKASSDDAPVRDPGMNA